jgi:hypothetical protein
MDMISTSQLIAFTYAAVALMLVIALYHIIIILVDVRKIVRKAANLSEHLESTVLQPLSWVEHGVNVVSSFLAAKAKQAEESEEDDGEKKHHAHKHHDKKD